jgi:nitroreductase
MSTKVNRRDFLKVATAAGLSLSLSPDAIFAAEPKALQLLKPPEGTGNSFLQLLWKRKSSREFSPAPLSLEVLSNLLWAAWGINRPDGRRTAPTASNRQEIDVYAATAGGLFLYEAKTNRLNPVLAEDIRGMTSSRQTFVKDVPVNLIYVADYAKMGKVPDEMKGIYSAAATGFISQNVYLYCASEGLSTVVRGSIDRSTLARVMKLRADQRIVLAQSVGYPSKKS